MDDECPGFTILDITNDGLIAQPKLSRLLPPHPSADEPYRRAQRASILLAARQGIDEAVQLLIAANQGPLRAECEAAFKVVRHAGCSPELLARIQGWISQPRPSLLERTVREVLPRSYSMTKGPAWAVLEERYRSWALAPAVEYALDLVRSAEPSNHVRLHRELVRAPQRGHDMPGELLTFGAVDDVRELWIDLPERLDLDQVALVEPVHQLIAYAHEFLEGNHPLAVLGLAA